MNNLYQLFAIFETDSQVWYTLESLETRENCILLWFYIYKAKKKDYIGIVIKYLS